MADQWVELLTVRGERVRLGTLVRLGCALGYDLDDLAVSRPPLGQVVLYRRVGAVGQRPPVVTVAEVLATMPPEALSLTRFCRQCGREFVSKDKARQHEDAEHAHPDARPCPLCGWVFLTDRGLAHHATMKHPDGQGLGPIERQQFDPDATRAAAAASL